MKRLQAEVTSPLIRRMTEADLLPVYTIEQSCHPFPWTIGILKDCLSVGYQCWVLEFSEVIKGFAMLSIAAQEAHVLNLCVDPTVRRKGYGRQLLEYLLECAQQHHVSTVFLEVRQSNQVAIMLYEQAGFSQVATRPNYYPTQQGRENAIIFAKQLQ